MSRRRRPGLSHGPRFRDLRRRTIAPPEHLEERTMLSPTPIGSGEQSAIRAGLKQLAVVGQEIDVAHQLAQPLPLTLTANGKAVDQNVGQLASLEGFLKGRLEDAVVDYFDHDGNPTVEGLQSALQALA